VALRIEWNGLPGGDIDATHWGVIPHLVFLGSRSAIIPGEGQYSLLRHHAAEGLAGPQFEIPASPGGSGDLSQGGW